VESNSGVSVTVFVFKSIVQLFYLRAQMSTGLPEFACRAKTVATNKGEADNNGNNNPSTKLFFAVIRALRRF
jgi:hypothetical protein